VEATVSEKPERQIEAIKLQQTWSIWLVTAQLAVLTVVAATAIGRDRPTNLSSWAEGSLLVGVCFSCLSMIAASVLASAHPSIVLRIKATAEDLNMKLWDFKYCPRALDVAIVEHYAFVLAVIWYGVYLGIRIFNP
jgi:hypothetical protein